MSPAEPLRTGRWTWGRRATVVRPLRADECAHLAHARRSAWRRVALAPLLLLAVLGGAAALAWGFGHTTGLLAAGIAIALLLAGLLGTAVVLLDARDRWRAATAAAKDLAAGTAELFEDVPADDAEPEHAPEAPLAVATGSGRVIEGPPPLLGRVVRIAEVAEGTVGAYRVRVQAYEDGSVVEQRHLNEGEREELRQAIARSRRLGRPVWVPLVILALVAFSWTAPGADRAAAALGDYLSSAFAIGMSVLSLWGWAVGFRRSFRMERDLEQGVALWTRHPGGGQEPFEFLPHSGMLWWTGRVPAEWRSFSRPAAGR